MSKQQQSDSVIKGGVALTVSRIVGMGFGFVLFLLLAWRSSEDVGVFRTLVTYFIISEMLPLLGMQKWLATEMSQRVNERRQLVVLGILFSLLTSIAIAICYIVISQSGIYGPDISNGLQWIASVTIASGVVLSTNAALVGIGFSHKMGVLNLIENIFRTSIGIALVISGASIIQVIIVFVITRWSIAIVGLLFLFNKLPPSLSLPSHKVLREFFRHVPKLAVIMVAFLVTRYAGMIILPWLRDEDEAGIFAAPFQLFDLVMLIPTVFAISSTFEFNKSAMNGISALRRSIDKLTYLTAIYILPIIALSVVLAEQIIVFLFHEPYLPAVVPFQVLMIATIVTAIDQILSQALVAMGRYRSDLISVVGGAASILIATSFLSVSHGALGAALAFLLSLTLTVIIRLFLIRSVLRLTNYWTLMSRQLFSASIAGIIIWIAKYLVPESVGTTNQYGWLLLLTLGVFINFGTLYLLGGISMAKRRWLLRFLRRRN